MHVRARGVPSLDGAACNPRNDADDSSTTATTACKGMQAACTRSQDVYRLLNQHFNPFIPQTVSSVLTICEISALTERQIALRQNFHYSLPPLLSTSRGAADEFTQDKSCCRKMSCLPEAAANAAAGADPPPGGAEWAAQKAKENKNKKRNERRKKRRTQGPLYPFALKVFGGPNQEEISLDQWREMKGKSSTYITVEIIKAEKDHKNTDEASLSEMKFVEVNIKYKLCTCICTAIMTPSFMCRNFISGLRDHASWLPLATGAFSCNLMYRYLPNPILLRNQQRPAAPGV